MKHFIAVDIGGTSIKYGVINEVGMILRKDEIKTEAEKGGQALLKKITDLIKEQMQSAPPIDGIGISTAGQVCPKSGSVLFATDNLPGWTGIELKKHIQDTFLLPVAVENDVNAAALGEKWLGAGSEVEDFLCLTIGTGIGGAIVINGKIYHGIAGTAGEFGHIVIHKGGKPCTCGSKGCFEQYASTKALALIAEEINLKNRFKSKIITGKMIFEEAAKGDIVCQEAIDLFINNMAVGIASLVHIFNPGFIIIGGGISAQGLWLSQKIEQAVKASVMPSFAKELHVCFAKLGNDAGILGSVYGLL